MYIKIEVFPSMRFETPAGFQANVMRMFHDLEDAITDQCVTSKSFAVGNGSILDVDGQIVATYSIQSAKPKDIEHLPNCRGQG